MEMETFYLIDSTNVLTFLLTLFLSFASSQTAGNHQQPFGDLIENDLRLRELSHQMITFRAELTKQFEDFRNEYLIRVVTLETKLEMFTKQMDRSNPIEIIKLFSESQKQICKLETSVDELKTGIGRISEKQQKFENVTRDLNNVIEVARQRDIKLQNISNNLHQEKQKIDSMEQELVRNVYNISTQHKQEIDIMIKKSNEIYVSDNFTLWNKLQNMSIEYNRQFRELQRFPENMTIKSEQTIAFTAGIPSYETYNIGQILNFTKVITNIGGGLNISDGVFYCPELGMYYFFVNIMSALNAARVSIYKNRHRIAEIYAGNGKNIWNVGSIAVIIQLDKSDQVFLKSNVRQLITRIQLFSLDLKYDFSVLNCIFTIQVMTTKHKQL
ncbi:hypothetical protein KUTeg_024317 [Tegillarca granosa]|uniref:C1q domain-containing protein n=1 Tax=Tegillarca granosa TaxID=220873 RepID=A0ABQ9DX01_TEGGR|nr:hypothetical protein KUTeg_024317 [Tegillarca granosa]